MATASDTVFDAIGAAWMDGDFSGLPAVMAADVKYHMPPIGEFDLEGLTQFISGFRQAFPDFRVTLDERIAEDDRVAWRWHCEATFSGASPVVPMAPTGKRTSATGTIVGHFGDGRIVELWHHGDWLTWLQVPLG